MSPRRRLCGFLIHGCLIVFGLLSAAQGQTAYRTIPMDCGGWFSGLAIHSSGRLYGFGDVFGMWRSDNAGQSWQYLQGDFTTFDHFINGCAVSTGNADKVAFLSDTKVFTSTDGGATWTNRLSGLTPRRDRGASPIVYHPGNDQELWLASTRSGFTGSLWRSTDGGTIWTKMGGSTFDSVIATTIYVRPEFPDQIWVGAVGGLYVSSNRGASFTQVWSNSGGVPPLNGAIPTVSSIVRRADGVGYMGTNTKGWRITATDYNNPATYNVTATVSWWSGWGPTLASVLADGSFLTITADENISRSFDGGLTWSPLSMGLVTPPTPPWRTAATVNTKVPTGGRDMIVQDPTNAVRWFMTGGKAPFITTDSGSTWRYPPNLSGLAGVKTYKTRFPRGVPDMAVVPCSDQGIFTVTDGGLSGGVATCARASIDEHFTFHDVLISDDGQTLIAAGNEQTTNRSALLRSTNGGATWTKIDLANSGLPPSYEGITRAVAAPGNTTDFLVLLGYNAAAGNNNPGLYRTSNGGASFTKVNGIPDGLETGMRYLPGDSWLETDGVSPGTRYLSLRASNNLAARGFWRSVDGGSTWAMTSAQPYGAQSYIDCMAVDRSIAGRVWVCNSIGLRRSDDGGNSWNTVGNFTNATRIDAAYGRIAVWGRLPGDTWNKLYYSPDNGVTWSEKSGPGHRFAYINDLAVDPNRAGQIWVSGNSIDLINPPALPSAPAPALPTNFAVNLVGLQANLSWTDVATDESGYAIEVRVGSATTFTLLTTTAADITAYSHTGLSDGVSYAYRIRALKAADNVASGYTAGLTVTPPATTLPLAPSALATSSLSTSSLLLSWADNAYNETGYQIERSTAPASGFTLLATTAAGATSYTDTSLGEGVRLYYRIRAVNALGNSAYTSVVPGGTTIAPPSNLIVTAASDYAVTLAWADNTSVETAYAIERSTSSGENYVEIATAAASATGYTDTTVVPGTTYFYRVRARNSVSVSDYAAEATALASNYQPPAFYEPFNYALSPASVLGRPFSGTGNSGNWRLPDGSSTVQDTLLAGSLVAGRIPGTGNQILLPNNPALGFLDLSLSDTTAALMNPPAAGSRTFWVSLIARSPNTLTTRTTALVFRTQTGVGSFALNLYTDPNARFALNMTGDSAATVYSANNSVTPNTTYLYIAKVTVTDTDGDATNGFEKREARLWQYPASTLPPLSEPTTGGIYRSPVSAASARILEIELYSGCSAASDSKFTFDEIRIGATYAQVALPPPPSAPTNLTFSNITGSTVTLGWTDNAADETAYVVQRALSPSGSFMTIATLPANTTLYSDTGLGLGLTYTYRVLATSSSGDSSALTANVTLSNTPTTGTDYLFNSSQADFEGTFNETAGWGTLWNATAGTGSSGGLATDSTDRGAILPSPIITFTTAGQAVDLSIAFKARVSTSSGTNTAGGEGLSLGLNRVDAPLLATGGYLVAGVSEASTNSLTSALSAISRNNAPGTVSTTDTTALALLDNEWYALDATITYNGANAFTVTSSLYGLGASGIANPVLLDTYSVTRAGLDSLVNVPLFAGFQGRSASGFGGVRAFDDFYAGLPAPASGLATFRTTHGLATNGSQDLLTPAGDGVANLLKYAFNMIGAGAGQGSGLTTPNASTLGAGGSAGLPFGGVDVTGKLQVTFIRRKASSNPGITYAVEFSDALASWAINPSATESATSIDSTFERVTVTDSSLFPKRFARMKVTVQ